MRSARYGKGRRLSLLVQAYAFIGLSIIVALLLSSGNRPMLSEDSSLDAVAPSGPGLFSRLSSFFSITGAAVDETAGEEQQAREAEEVQEGAEGEVEELTVDEPEATEQFSLDFEPGDSRSLTTLATSDALSIGTVTLTNNGDKATNVKLSVKSRDGLFAPEEFVLGIFERGESGSEDIRVDFNDKAVAYGIESDAPDYIVLKFALGFADAGNLLHQDSYTSTLPALGHRIVENAPRGYARFIPESDSLMDRFVAEHLGGVRAKDTLESQRLSARWIFESLETLNIEVLPDSQNEVRFPAETLNERKGTPADFAVLYAALLHNAGFEAALISFPEEERLLAAYTDSRGLIYPIAAEAPTYEEALTEGFILINKSPHSTILLNETWKDFPSARFPSEELDMGKWPSMTRQIGRCALEPVAAGISKAKVPVRLSNTGSVDGIGCVGLVHYEGDMLAGQKFECYTVEPGKVLEPKFDTLIIGNYPSCEEI